MIDTAGAVHHSAMISHPMALQEFAQRVKLVVRVLKPLFFGIVSSSETRA